MHGDMLVTHSLLAKLLACSKSNAQCVCVYEISQTVRLSWKKRCGRGAVAMWNATAFTCGTAGDERWVRNTVGHGLLLQAPQWRAGALQPNQVGVELSRSSPRSCNLLFQSDLGSYDHLWWLHSTHRSVGGC